MTTTVIEELIAELKGRYAIFMATHNFAKARRIFDELAVCWVKDGASCIVETGSVEKMFTVAENPISKNYISGTLAGS